MVLWTANLLKRLNSYSVLAIDKPFTGGKRLAYDVEENDYHNSKRLAYTCEHNNLSLTAASRNASPVQVFHLKQSLTPSFKSRGSTTENVSHAKHISCEKTNLISTHYSALQHLKEKPQAYPPENCSSPSLLQLSIEDSVALRVKQYRLASTKLTSHLPTSKKIT